MSAPITWQKSSYSQEGGNCVELGANTDGALKLRESDAPTRIATVSHRTLSSFLAGIKTGDFDQLAH